MLTTMITSSRNEIPSKTTLLKTASWWGNTHRKTVRKNRRNRLDMHCRLRAPRPTPWSCPSGPATPWACSAAARRSPAGCRSWWWGPWYPAPSDSGWTAAPAGSGCAAPGRRRPPSGSPGRSWACCRPCAAGRRTGVTETPSLHHHRAPRHESTA